MAPRGRHRSAALTATLLLPLLLAAPSARADWPCARHDPQRTGFVPGTSNVDKPGLLWRYYLGGALRDNQYVMADVNGDGKVKVVYVEGGRLIAKLPDDTIVWNTPPLSLSYIVDVWDVDGDGTLDVVVDGSPASVDIFSGKDGSLEWSMPAGYIAQIAGDGDTAASLGSVRSAYANLGGIRTADLNGDGKRDLYVVGHHCGSLSSGDTVSAVVFSFAGGFAAASRPLYTIPLGSGDCSAQTDTIADVDGDGKPEVVMAAFSLVQVFNGQTGALKFTSTSGADGILRSFEADMDAAPALGDKRNLLVYFEDNSFGGHRALAYAYDPTAAAPNQLIKRWEHDAGSAVATDRIAYDAHSLGRFDSTGAWQVAYSLYDSTAGAWTLYVADALSGSVLASQPGAILAGTADVDGDGLPELLATVGGTLDVFKLTVLGSGADGGPVHTLSGRSTLLGSVTLAHHLDRSLAAWKGLAAPVITTDVDGDKTDEVVVVTSSSPPAFAAEDLSGSGVAKASYTPPAGDALLATEVATDPATGLPQPYLVLSSGYLVVLDPRSFASLNMVLDPTFPRFGMTVGGYYSGSVLATSDLSATPVVGTFAAGGAPSVLVDDSRGNLVRLDPGAAASVAAPPSPVWTIANAIFPSLVDLDGDKLPEVVVQTGPGTPAAALTAFKADGATRLWSTPVAGVVDDPLFGDANGDGTPDIFYETVVPGSTSPWLNSEDVLDGKSGTALWSSAYSARSWGGASPIAVGDMNGDGKADAVTADPCVAYLSGPDGTVLASDTAHCGYWEPLLGDVLGLGAPQAFVHGGYQPSFLDDATGKTRWTVPSTGPSQHWTDRFAGLATCGSQKLFVEGDYSSPILYAYDAETGAMAWSEALASGSAYPTLGSVPPSTPSGILSSVTIKQDLTGAGHPSALVGSADGYLYAVQPCAAGAIDWVYPFGYPVGDPVVADTTGSGTDQVLVSVADGYLYALNRETTAPVPYVYAVDPPGGHPHDPVATLHTVSTLYAEWPTVAGITQYQWAVFTSGGLPVGTAGYTTVTAVSGTVVDVTASALPLADGGRYYFAVRAVGPSGASSDALSNVVQVVFAPLDAGPPDARARSDAQPDAGRSSDAAGERPAAPHAASGCGCAVGGHESPASRDALGLLLLGLVAAVAARLRRRRCATVPRASSRSGSASAIR